jgi:hypothetical protein
MSQTSLKVRRLSFKAVNDYLGSRAAITMTNVDFAPFFFLRLFNVVFRCRVDGLVRQTTTQNQFLNLRTVHMKVQSCTLMIFISINVVGHPR